MEDDQNKNNSNKENNQGETNNPESGNVPDNNKPENSTPEKSIEDIEKEILQEKNRELELIRQKNQKIEEQLRGKGQMAPPEKSPEQLLDEECNKMLEGTGFKI